MKTYEKYWILSDIHLNEFGHKFIANKLISKFCPVVKTMSYNTVNQRFLKKVNSWTEVHDKSSKKSSKSRDSKKKKKSKNRRKRSGK